MSTTVELNDRNVGEGPRGAGDRADRDWHVAGRSGHVVQFYSDPRYLIRLLSQYVGTALVSGDAAIVIATPEHIESLGEVLEERGLDVSVAESRGRYVALDAAATLAKIVRNGAPDPDRFKRIVGGQMAQVAANNPSARIAAFGEMVALLWKANRPDAAIRLEELWNDLAGTYQFSLCCAYPMRGFSNALHATPFVRICAQHSHVFPAERADADSLQ